MQGSTASHEQHRVLTIRGKGYCDSDCIFCIEKHGAVHPDSPVVDQVRSLILRGSGRYNMLFFANGEPSLSPKLLEHVTLGRAQGYRYFGMSSHFRAFADPAVALRTLEMGFEYFDISLHAANRDGQLAVNPIDDGGESLREALHGLRNVIELASRLRKKVSISHKIVISRLNYRELLSIFMVTHRLGVRHYVLQPVKSSDLAPDVARRLEITEEEYLPYLNELLRRTEGSGARIKLYGMSQLGVYESAAIEQEQNLVKNSYGKARRRLPVSTERGEAPVPRPAPARSPGVARRSYRVSLHPANGPAIDFDCGDDQYILNAALASGAEISYGCRMGSCSSCCSKIVQGEVDLGEQLVLTDDDTRRGYTLLCRARPRSDLVIAADREADLDR